MLEASCIYLLVTEILKTLFEFTGTRNRSIVNYFCIINFMKCMHDSKKLWVLKASCSDLIFSEMAADNVYHS